MEVLWGPQSKIIPTHLTGWARNGVLCRVYLTLSLGLCQPWFSNVALWVCKSSTRYALHLTPAQNKCPVCLRVFIPQLALKELSDCPDHRVYPPPPPPPWRAEKRPKRQFPFRMLHCWAGRSWLPFPGSCFRLHRHGLGQWAAGLTPGMRAHAPCCTTFLEFLYRGGPSSVEGLSFLGRCFLFSTCSASGGVGTIS